MGNRQGLLDLRALGDKYGLRFPARHGSLSESTWDGEIAAAKILGQEMVGEGGTGGAGSLGNLQQTLATARSSTSSASARSRPASVPRTSTTTTASSARASPTTACSRARGRS